MKDKIKYICNKIKSIYYSDNKIDLVEEILINLNDINYQYKYLLELSILYIKSLEFNSIKDWVNGNDSDSDLINNWDKDYDNLCKDIIHIKKIDDKKYTKINKEDLENLLANPLWKSLDSSIIEAKNLTDNTLKLNSLIKPKKNE